MFKLFCYLSALFQTLYLPYLLQKRKIVVLLLCYPYTRMVLELIYCSFDRVELVISLCKEKLIFLYIKR